MECLDEAGRPLFITSRPQRTGLVRVMAALLMTAPGRRTHLWRQPQENEFPALWSVAALGPVLVGEAREDCLWRLLNAQSYWTEALQYLSDLPVLRSVNIVSPEESASFFPPQSHGRVRLHLYTARLPVLPSSCTGPAALTRYPEHLWLDTEEIEGFRKTFRNRIAPLAGLYTGSMRPPRKKFRNAEFEK